MTSVSADKAAALAACRRTEPSAQPVASSTTSPAMAQAPAVTHEAFATKDPTCNGAIPGLAWPVGWLTIVE